MTLDQSRLERAALGAFASIYGRDVPDLAHQLEVARVVSRQNTGGGFYTDLRVDRAMAKPVACPSPLDGLAVRIHGMTMDIELMLFFRDGYAHLLEGYTYAPEGTTTFDLGSQPFGEVTLQWPKRHI